MRRSWIWIIGRLLGAKRGLEAGCSGVWADWEPDANPVLDGRRWAQLGGPWVPSWKPTGRLNGPLRDGGCLNARDAPVAWAFKLEAELTPSGSQVGSGRDRKLSGSCWERPRSSMGAHWECPRSAVGSHWECPGSSVGAYGECPISSLNGSILGAPKKLSESTMEVPKELSGSSLGVPRSSLGLPEDRWEHTGSAQEAKWEHTGSAQEPARSSTGPAWAFFLGSKRVH